MYFIIKLKCKPWFAPSHVIQEKWRRFKRRTEQHACLYKRKMWGISTKIKQALNIQRFEVVIKKGWKESEEDKESEIGLDPDSSWCCLVTSCCGTYLCLLIRKYVVLRVCFFVTKGVTHKPLSTPNIGDSVPFFAKFERLFQISITLFMVDVWLLIELQTHPLPPDLQILCL